MVLYEQKGNIITRISRSWLAWGHTFSSNGRVKIRSITLTSLFFHKISPSKEGKQYTSSFFNVGNFYTTDPSLLRLPLGATFTKIPLPQINYRTIYRLISVTTDLSPSNTSFFKAPVLYSSDPLLNERGRKLSNCFLAWYPSLYLLTTTRLLPRQS